MKKIMLLIISVFCVFILGACEKELIIKNYKKIGNTEVSYYKDYVYVNFITEGEEYYSDYDVVFKDEKNQIVYSLFNKCHKYACSIEIPYTKFPENGTFTGVATLEDKTKAEFKIILPIPLSKKTDNSKKSKEEKETKINLPDGKYEGKFTVIDGVIVEFERN